MKSEIEEKANFSEIRYAQCWEDADVLLEALDVKPGDRCVSIASAGDNTLALLSKKPAEVFALDLNSSQLACLELRAAAYRTLSHEELLILVGSKEGKERLELYNRAKPFLSEEVKRYWDSHLDGIKQGIGKIGKFERYLSLFRTKILPCIHSQKTISFFLENHEKKERENFYKKRWDNWKWRIFFKIFFSRFVMGKLGRDPSFFEYVKHDVPVRILARARHAFVELNPYENPYLQWILTENHKTSLPYALRPENFESIRENLDALKIRRSSLEKFLESSSEKSINRFNLSDIFEYMSFQNYTQLLEKIIKAGKPGSRLVYWNMMVLRKKPETLSTQLKELENLARELHLKDKTFFYSGLAVEEII
jgi:S-adenosylmethionine-diacylglycerol 3-amino-3-carboxypropyl transferase